MRHCCSRVRIRSSSWPVTGATAVAVALYGLGLATSCLLATACDLAVRCLVVVNGVPDRSLGRLGRRFRPIALLRLLLPLLRIQALAFRWGIGRHRRSRGRCGRKPQPRTKAKQDLGLVGRQTYSRVWTYATLLLLLRAIFPGLAARPGLLSSRARTRTSDCAAPPPPGRALASRPAALVRLRLRIRLRAGTHARAGGWPAARRPALHLHAIPLLLLALQAAVVDEGAVVAALVAAVLAVLAVAVLGARAKAGGGRGLVSSAALPPPSLLWTPRGTAQEGIGLRYGAQGLDLTG